MDQNTGNRFGHLKDILMGFILFVSLLMAILLYQQARTAQLNYGTFKLAMKFVL